MKNVLNSPAKARGVATIEMTIIIPILLLLGFAVIEVSHLILAKNISTAIVREGANLASRSTVDSDQEIMDALALSAAPLDLSKDGVIYISVIVGEESSDPYISEQHRWLNSGNASSSHAWDDCPSWDSNGSCILPPSKPRLSNFEMALSPGETVHVVEVIYDYSLLSRYVFDQNFLIYSHALM